MESRHATIERDHSGSGGSHPLHAKPLANLWHDQPIEEVLRRQESDSGDGLESGEAAQRLIETGPNEIPSGARKHPLQLLARQFTSLMVLILIGAAVVSVGLGDTTDAAAILAIVILNALLGFRQEYRAERALESLQRLSQPSARVRRDGRLLTVPSRELVPGDVVVLEAGNAVPADCRLIDVTQLRTHEAALTGESEAVHKDAHERVPSGAAIGDRRNMVYAGTTVTQGRGTAVVVETGPRTELGRIADLIRTTEPEPTRLQVQLDAMSRRLAAAAFAIVGIVFGMGMWRGAKLTQMVITSISLAVAAVPEGLPAVVTITLALGSQRMLRRRALVRKLAAVETLGAVTVICTDKTGTLTGNRMRVTQARISGRTFRLPLTNQTADPDLQLLLAAAALCNDATLDAGDPMEVALIQAARDAGIGQELLHERFPRVSELPFDSTRKRMTTIHRVTDAVEPVIGGLPLQAPFLAVTKGALEGLLSLSDSIWIDGKIEPLCGQRRDEIFAAFDRLASSGARVLGVAFRGLADPEPRLEEAEAGLTIAGMVALADPARPEVPAAIETCRAAGIRPIMITGDHPLTSRYVAAEIGLAAADTRTLTGVQLAALSPESLDAAVRDVSVFARVTPENKLAIVEALQRNGDVVAMTGDGVNDAPALMRADIGVAMGGSGTDVAREAGTIVLQDDNFATIVAAVEEGRTIYDNIRKFTRYLLACNSGELLTMLLAPAFGLPLPLQPIQILWMNLVTDGLPALALSVEPAGHDTMRRPPRRPSESILGASTGWWVLRIGLLLSLVSLVTGSAFLVAGKAWQTALFTTLTLSQVFLALAARSEREPIFSLGFFTNKAILGAFALTVLLQLGVIYLPAAREFLHTEPLSAAELSICIAMSAVAFVAAEIGKWWRRRRRPGLFTQLG